jgi:hypothetical protein
MKMARWIALSALLFISATPVSAQEYLYDNGVFVGMGAKASIYDRDRTIHYGFPTFCGPTPFCVPQRKGFSGTDINDVTGSPTLTLGYKLSDDDAISLKGDWARYSVSRNVTAPDSTGFITVAVDGANGVFIPPGNGPTNVSIDWDSDVFNTALEYQRRLVTIDLARIFGLVGFKFRYEKQNFDAKAVNATLVPSIIADSYHETLKEFLFGPYAGMKFSYKPDKQSRWNFSTGGNIGWYFKNASFDGRDRFFNGQHFSQHDYSKKGTLFAGAEVNVIYAINRNWFVDVGYEFNWIQAAAHIWNTAKTPADVSATTPSRIVRSQVLTHSPGVKVVYKFD